MNVKRYYGDNGQLLRYEVGKEMKNRGKRMYYTAMIKDIAIKFTIVTVVGVILLAVLLTHY
jgi:hypothetical protein